MLATLSHPGLVTLHDAGTVHGDDGSEQVYLVMELVEGPTLAERLRDGALDVEQTARVGRDVAEALATVHEREIVHRDIKPANMLLTSADALDTTRRRGEPAVKLADFGIARLADATRLTMTGMTLGTMSYLSPEQATGSELGPAQRRVRARAGPAGVRDRSARRSPAPMAEMATARLVAAPDVPVDLDPRLGDLLARMTRMAPQDRPDARDGGAGAGGDRCVGRRRGRPCVTCPAAADAQDPEEPRRGLRHAERHGRRPRDGSGRHSSAVRVVLLVGGTVLVGQLAAGDGTPTAPPSYPAVEGAVGESLTQLQESVEP